MSHKVVIDDGHRRGDAVFLPKMQDGIVVRHESGARLGVILGSL